ncbi:MAG: hypothetical protein ABI946_11405, partial [Chthoniobacterales bacterium]
MEVTDAPKFAPGDRNILFVENNGRQFVPLVGIMHGYFRVERDGPAEQETVANDEGKKVHNIAALGKDETVSMDAAGAALTAGAFKAAIRTQLASSAR